MPRGVTLANTLLALKAEIGYSLTAGVAAADDQQLYRLIDNEQKRLAADYDWPHLDKYADVAAGVGTRNLNFPGTAVVLERPLRVERKFNTLWQEISHGIEDRDYNTVDSDLGRTMDPIQKWRLNSDGSTFEVWPVPATAQTVRFHGQRPITSLQTAGVYDPTKVLDLDDILVVLFVAANRLLRMKQQDGELMLQRAQNRLQMLRVSGPPIRQRETILGGDSSGERLRRNVGMTVVVAP
jgi:hypothetical protein